MQTPLLLLGASIIFWGWHINLLIISMLLGIALEAVKISKFSIEINDVVFDRVSDITTILNIAFLLFIFFTNTFEETWIITYIKWLPLLFFPIIFFQILSDRRKIPFSSLFYTQRKKRSKDYQESEIDFSFYYVAICLLSASASNVESIAFYSGAAILILYGLFPSRSDRFHITHWLGLVVLIVSAGYLGHIILSKTQLKLETVVEEIFLELFGDEPDPFFRQTKIGSIGEMKLSGKIVYRVKSDKPMLLRRAVFDQYNNRAWYASVKGWNNISADKSNLYLIKKTETVGNKISIYGNNKHDELLLIHPNGSIAYKGLTVDRLDKNLLGTIKVIKKPGYLYYNVEYKEKETTPPSKETKDTLLRKTEKNIFPEFIGKYRLNDLSPQEVILKLKHIFANEYQYTLDYRVIDSKAHPLADFLYNNKAGHCEYYATVTVLILRSLGIPARYVSGYSLSEYDSAKNLYLVRERHAHAWATVWVNGQWIDVDTTPAIWHHY
ncbi:MAG: transglutaminase family protein [Nitrospinae bacterium]|nr:transglutaminase family protein [Nitrospinota bacterium]